MANTSTEGSASEFGRPEGGTGRRRFFSSGRIPRKTRIGSSSAARLIWRGAGASPPPITPTRSTMSSGLAHRTSSSSSYSMPSPPTPTAVPLTARCLFTVLGLFGKLGHRKFQLAYSEHNLCGPAHLLFLDFLWCKLEDLFTGPYFIKKPNEDSLAMPISVTMISSHIHKLQSFCHL